VTFWGIAEAAVYCRAPVGGKTVVHLRKRGWPHAKGGRTQPYPSRISKCLLGVQAQGNARRMSIGREASGSCGPFGRAVSSPPLFPSFKENKSVHCRLSPDKGQERNRSVLTSRETQISLA